jgi:hypothetical protein
MGLIDSIERAASRGTLPAKEEYTRLLERAITALEHERAEARPSDSTGLSGGLVRLDPAIPTMALPDLHGRFAFFQSVLMTPFEGYPTAVQAAEEGALQILCLGDGFHSERRGKRRWIAAFDEYAGRFRRREAMDAEMNENLTLMEMVMECKCALRERFHFLKGNHENIANEEGNGNHAFRKFSLEGEMVKEYVRAFYGEDFLELYALFEKRLPLIAIGVNFIASHAEPEREYTEEELVEARNLPEVTLGLTWTGNGESEDGTVGRMLSRYLGSAEGMAYIAGHRPVPDAYLLRADGLFVQIHNPEREQVAVLRPDRPFFPETDIMNFPS